MNRPRKASDQRARFIAAAKQLGVDETGKKFERAMKKIAKAEKPQTLSKLKRS
jgi:hypothetical protein